MLRSDVMQQLAVETGLLDIEAASRLAAQHKGEAPNEPFEQWAEKSANLSRDASDQLLTVFAQALFRCMACRAEMEGSQLSGVVRLHCPACGRYALKRVRNRQTTGSTPRPSDSAAASTSGSAEFETAAAVLAASQAPTRAINAEEATAIRVGTDTVSGPFPVGSQIGGCTLGEVAGRGGACVVYKGTHAEWGETAVKVLVNDSEEMRHRFNFEASVGLRLEHEHVVRVLDSGERNGMPYLVLEWVGGGSVEDRVKAAGPMDVRQALQTAIQVGMALDAAHRIGVIHRDLKPANILLTTTGSAKITDFGLARLEFQDIRVTRAGAILGTPAYMSPEQALGQQVTPATDIYLLGCTLWFMLVGKPPYMSDSAHGLLGQHISVEMPTLTEVRPDAPPALDQVIKWMCEKEPANRVGTMSDAVAMLRTLL